MVSPPEPPPHVHAIRANSLGEDDRAINNCGRMASRGERGGVLGQCKGRSVFRFIVSVKAAARLATLARAMPLASSSYQERVGA